MGFLTGSFPKTMNIETGKDKLDSAFKVFEDAKAQANEAISALQTEQDAILLETKILEEEYKAKLQEKTLINDEISAQKVRAMSFISKIQKIIE